MWLPLCGLPVVLLVVACEWCVQLWFPPVVLLKFLAFYSLVSFPLVILSLSTLCRLESDPPRRGCHAQWDMNDIPFSPGRAATPHSDLL